MGNGGEITGGRENYLIRERCQVVCALDGELRILRIPLACPGAHNSESAIQFFSYYVQIHEYASLKHPPAHAQPIRKRFLDCVRHRFFDLCWRDDSRDD